MRVKPYDFNKFFEIGRELGWDPEKRIWTVKPFVSPSSRHPYLKDIVEFPPDFRLDWSGEWFGPLRLKQVINESQGYKLDPSENIYVTHGTEHANWLVTTTIVDPGEEVVIDIPTWMTEHRLCEIIGAKIKVIKRREEKGWKFDLDELNEIVTPKTKMIFINHPNNPTGATFTAKEMRTICEIAGDVGAYVLSDEIYRGLEYDGFMSSPSVVEYEKGVSTGSVSKTVGMDGVRIGWLASLDKDLVKSCKELNEVNTLAINSRLDEFVATAVLQPEKFKELVRKSMEEGRENRKVVDEWISKKDYIDWVMPTAGYLSFLRYDLEIGSWDLCIKLLKEPYKIYLFPGVSYGFEKHLRLGWGGIDTKSVQKILEQIDKFVESFRKGRI